MTFYGEGCQDRLSLFAGCFSFCVQRPPTLVSRLGSCKDTFNRHDEAFTEGFDGPQERLRSGGHVFMKNDLALLIQDTDVHRSGVEIDSTRCWCDLL